jgi:hypothetical protein
VWVKYNGLAATYCQAVCLSCDKLVTLLVDEAKETPAEIFREDALLNNMNLLKEMLESLNHP